MPWAPCPPGGLPEAFLEEVEEPLTRLARRYARTHGPFTTREIGDRYSVDFGPALRELEQAGDLVRGELRPGGSEREWCDSEVLRRLRRASLASLRKEVEPAEQKALARFLPAWQGVDAAPPGGAGVDRLREQLVPLQGLALSAETWERDVLPRRLGAYSQAWLDSLCASGELVWVGAGSIGRNSGKVALLFREDAPLLGPPPVKGDAPDEPLHHKLRERLTAGAAFWTDLLADVEAEPAELQEALWDLVWAGEVTNDAFAPLRAPRLSLARQNALRPPLLSPAAARRPAAAGSLVAHRAAVPRRPRPRHAGARAGRAAAGALRHRHPRGRAGRGHPRRLRLPVRRVGQPGDAGHRPARLLRRGAGRRAVRAARRRGAPARPALRRAGRPARAGRHRPREPLRRHAALAQARGLLRGGPRACRAPTW